MAIGTLYLPSVPLYLTLHPLYLCHQTQGISYTTPTLCMTSHTIRVTSYSVCMLSQLFWTLHTSMYNFTPSIFMTSYPICTLSPYRFHENKTTIPDISPAIFDITSTVSVSSSPGYHLYHTHSLDDITHTIRVTSYSVFMLSQQLFMTLYPSMYNITLSIFMISYPICTLSPYCFHDKTTTIPNISPSIFDTTDTVSVSSHKYHTHLYCCSAVSMTSQVCKSSHLTHV